MPGCRLHPCFNLSVALFVALFAGALGAGCVQDQQKTAVVSSQFFDGAVKQSARANMPAADESLCVRVDYVGRKVLADNPDIGMKPLFATIASPQPELFHVDQRIVYITDGLVKQLPSEAELASALSYELARMVAQREARVKRENKLVEPRPPIRVPVGNDGQFPTSDMVSTVELARYDQARKASRADQNKPVRVQPDQLARTYLEKSGFQRSDFDRVLPLLQAADKNSSLEKQVKGLTSSGAWTP